MEENSAAVECLILFYINMKQVLKTKKLIERVFLDEMIKQCKESGFNNYSDEEIKDTWRSIVTQYLYLKTKGTAEEKESWKYFEILDSCYEHSDFHNGVYPKFSEDMVWFLIECFLKRKALKKTQKQSSIVAEVHKEFLQCGYLYITKQDIENKWRNLNLKYEKLKGDPEALKKWPYLQALIGYQEENYRHIVNMVFTKELTEILIERFTEKKITCVIHGYDSDQVLTEIQSEFKDLGFYFSKEDIKEKWRTLTNIYKFLIVKGKEDNNWIHFTAMRKHFKDDFLFPWGRMDRKIGKPRRVRQRSKSLGPELVKRDVVQPSLVVQLEKVSPSSKLKMLEGEKHSPKKKPSKRGNGEYRRSKSRKKLKVAEESNIDHQNRDACKVTENGTNKNQSSENSKSKPSLFQGPHLKLSFDGSQERRNSADLGSPTSKVHIINIDHSNIDRNNGNLTINLPSITKQFSDNEFLPLKKRLRIDGDHIEQSSGTSTKDIKDGFLGFPAIPDTTQKLSMEKNEDKRLTEEEMKEIMERIDKEKSRNYETNNKPDNEISTNYYGTEEFNNYQNMYNNFGQQCLVVPKEELQDNLSVQNYNNPSTITQPPVLLLVIKVDGSNNPVKDSTPNEVNLKEGSNNQVRDIPNESNKEFEKKIASDKQKEEQPSVPHHEFVKPISPKGKTIIISKKKDLIPLEMNSPGLNNTNNNNSEIMSNSVNSTSSEIISESVATENKEVIVHNSGLHIETNELNDLCTVGENVTVYTTEESHNEHFDMENKIGEPQKTEEVTFREPLSKTTSTPIKQKVFNKTPFPVLQNNATPQAAKYQTSAGKVRLPVKGGGKLKEIFISARELNKIAKLKPQTSVKVNNLRKPSEINIKSSPEKKTPEFKYMSQVIKPATYENLSEIKNNKKTNCKLKLDEVPSPSLPNDSFLTPQSFKFGSKPFGTGKNEEFENESVMSEAIGDDDGLKDNLLATVIDFQEQNNQEFIEIKNLMKQNNLLQRETNRLLRLMLEKQ